jgi:hypothetical protein
MAVMRITISDRDAALFRPTAKMPTRLVSTRRSLDGGTADRAAGD